MKKNVNLATLQKFGKNEEKCQFGNIARKFVKRSVWQHCKYLKILKKIVNLATLHKFVKNEENCQFGNIGNI